MPHRQLAVQTAQVLCARACPEHRPLERQSLRRPRPRLRYGYLARGHCFRRQEPEHELEKQDAPCTSSRGPASTRRAQSPPWWCS